MPAGVVTTLVVQRRWRRLGVVVFAALAGAAAFALLNIALDLVPPLSSADRDTWVLSARFPSLYYVAGAAAAATVGKPWLPRSWRRASDVSLLVLAVVMAVVGSAGVPELLFAVALGGVVGGTLLTVLGAPNRRPSAADVASSAARRGARGDRPVARAGRGWAVPALRGHDAGRAQLREGKRSGQPGRRSAVPRLSHAAAARFEGRSAVAVVVSPGRARGVADASGHADRA